MSSQHENANPISIVWIDDQVEKFQDLVELLENDSDFEVKGLFTDPNASLDYVSEQHPDIALVDVDMPVISGLDLTPKLKDSSPETRAIILSVHAEKFIIREAIKRGASGFMAKSDAGEQLLQIARSVNQGNEPIFSKSVQEALNQ